MLRLLGGLAATLALFSAAGSAQAAQGLNGRYFNTIAAFDNEANEIYADANTPYATFIANNVCFPDCGFGSSIGDGASLSQFLGVSAGHASNLSQDIGGVGSHILILDGFLKVTSAGLYNFSLSSDDGSLIRIGGVDVVDSDGLHGPSNASGSINLAAGSHAIRIIQWENGGGTNLQARINGDVLGGAYLSTSSGAGGVPEPGAWALMILGFGAAGSALRRRKAVTA